MARKHTPEYSHCGYIRDAIETDRLANTVRSAVEALRPLKGEFDAIAFTGMSGAMVAPALALRLKKPLIMVRKSTDVSHSNEDVEGDRAARRVLIVDDFQSSGKTARRIASRIKAWSGAECIGVFPYHNGYDKRIEPIQKAA